MKTKDMILKCFGGRIKAAIENTSEKTLEQAEEIRIRINKPICLIGKEEYFLTLTGETKNELSAFIPNAEDIINTIEIMSDFSIYAFEEELRKGYITLSGGFRVGISGKVVLENNSIKTIKNISALNFRIAKEIKGCCENIISHITTPNIMNTLIISPPNCGKTTLLRDIIRHISNNGINGQTVKIAICDERSEIAGSYMGVAQLDVGLRTDVLDACPKDKGMMILLRAMSPNIIAVDEIGGKKDIEAIEHIVNCGINILATVHGKTMNDIIQRISFEELLKKRIFERFIILSRRNGAGTVEKICNERYKEMYI